MAAPATEAPRFVGIAIGRYATLPPLSSAVTQMQTLGDLLHDRHGFEAHVLDDLSRGALLDAIDLHLAPGSASGRTLILAWTGHGRLGVDGTLRLLAMAAGQDADVAQAGQLGEWASRTGARQVLVVIDTCHAGGGVLDAARLASAVDAGRDARGTGWFGVIAASQADEPSREGALAGSLHRLLEHGPREPDFRWDAGRPSIRGDDLVQALMADWREPRHRPFPLSLGVAWDLVRNPLHVRRAPGEPIDHLLNAARGGSGTRSFFTGRSAVLSELASWIRAAAPGMRVLTGSAGCGKSAIAGRLVSLSAPEERRRLLAAEAVPVELDPGEGSIDAQLQARALTLTTAAQALSASLALPADGDELALLTHARRQRAAGEALVIVVDGLDEAQAACGEIVSGMLLPLAREALVLVATRDLRLGDTSLVFDLAREGGVVIDLDRHAASASSDLHRYVQRRLEGVAASMDPVRVADAVATMAGRTAPFLLARLVTERLRDEPIDTATAGWELALSTTVQNALDRDLGSAVLEFDGKPVPGAAREVLAALAHAFGGGFPADDVWPAVATATSRLGLRYTREHTHAVVAALGRHIVRNQEGEQQVYGLSHQLLAEYLSPERGDDANRAVAQAVAAVYEELLDAGIAPREPGYLWRHAWQHLALADAPGLERLERLADRDRAAFLPDLGAALLSLGAIAWDRNRMRESMALAQRAVDVWRQLGDRKREAESLFQLAVAAMSAGEREASDRAATQAVEVARGMGNQPEGQGLLARALLARAQGLVHAGWIQTGIQLAEEAAAMAEAAAQADPDAREMLAATHVAAARLAAVVGEHAAAESHAASGLALFEALAASDEQTLRPGHAEALVTTMLVRVMTGLAAAPDAEGRRRVPIDTAAGERLLAEHRRIGAGSNMRDILVAQGLVLLARARQMNGAALADFDAVLDEAISLVEPFAPSVVDAAAIAAMALQARAEGLSADDPARAEQALTQAADMLRVYAASSPALGCELGIALSSRLQITLGRAAMAGRPPPADANALAQEAVSLLRPAAAPQHRMGLAHALGLLAYLQMAAGDAALASVTRAEAIAVWREVAALSAPARLPLALNLIDQAHGLLAGRAQEALEAAREAMSIAAVLPAPHRDLVSGLGMANAGAALCALGRDDEARPLLEGAARPLAAPAETNAVARGALAGALCNLSQIALRAGQPDAAVDPARQSLVLLEGLDALPGYAQTRLSASLALARSLRATEQGVQGQQMLDRILDGLVTAMRDGQPEGEALAEALNIAAPDQWDAVLARMADRPDLVARLDVGRRWPVDQIDRAVTAVLAALDRAQGDDRRLVREIARDHRRAATEAFDRAWAARTGDVPAWLRLEPGLIQEVLAWWNTPNWTLSARHLGARVDMLTRPAVDEILDELALDPASVRQVEQHRGLMHAARQGRLEAHCAPLILREEIDAWAASPNVREHFIRHEAALLRPALGDELRRHAHQPRARGVHGSLDARLEHVRRRERHHALHGGVRDRAFLGVELRGGVGRVWWAGGQRGGTPRQRAMATIARNQSDDAAVRAHAAAVLLIARAIESGHAEVDPVMRSDVLAAPDGASAFVRACAQAMLVSTPAAVAIGELMTAVTRQEPAA